MKGKFRNLKIEDPVFSTVYGFGKVLDIDILYGIYILYPNSAQLWYTLEGIQVAIDREQTLFTIYMAKKLGWLDKKGKPYTCDKCSKFMQQSNGMLTTLNARCSECRKKFVDSTITPNPDIKVNTQAWVDDMQRISDEDNSYKRHQLLGRKLYEELERLDNDLKVKTLENNPNFLAPDPITWPLEKTPEERLDEKIALYLGARKIDYTAIQEHYMCGKNMHPRTRKALNNAFNYMKGRYTTLDKLPLKK